MGKRAHDERTITKRADGCWKARASVGYTPEGKLKRHTIYGRTQSEVREKPDRVKQQVSAGTYTNTRFSFDEFLEYWLREKRHTVKPTTFETYALCIPRFIVPHVGRARLEKLTPLQVQGLISEVRDTYGTASAAKCRSVLLNAYGQALKRELVSRNPLEVTDAIKEEPREIRLWEVDEATRFLDVARIGSTFSSFMVTGLGRGELLGLRWSDIGGNLLYVRQALVKVGSRLVLSTPKTRRVFVQSSYPRHTRGLAVAP